MLSSPAISDRVKETSTTTGTGTITLAGAAPGFRSFSTAFPAASTQVYYCIATTNPGDWEVGIGTFTLSGTTLSRTTILASSNAGSAVNFAAGTKDVFVTLPASVMLNFIDINGGTLVNSLYTRGAFGMRSSSIGGNPVIYDVQDQTGNVVIEIGRTDGTSSTNAMDFHTGATAVDYDSRILVSGGNGTSGNGTMNFLAANFQHNSSTVLTAANVATYAATADTTSIARWAMLGT